MITIFTHFLKPEIEVREEIEERTKCPSLVELDKQNLAQLRQERREFERTVIGKGGDEDEEAEEAEEDTSSFR